MSQIRTFSQNTLHTLLNASKKISTPGSQKACVFDMDSTLFCVSSRTEKILREFAFVEGNFSEDLKKIQPLLQSVTLTPEDWGMRSGLERLNIRLSEPDVEVLKQFWRERFFSNDYLKYDLLYDQSNEFVQLCHQVGFKIFYLTGRSDRKMRPGTLAQLRKYQFPLESENDLIMRSDEFHKDEDFKVQKLNELKPNFEKIYFFENEPVIINRVLKSSLDAIVIYMNSTHSGKEEVEGPIGTITPSSYSEFFNEMRK